MKKVSLLLTLVLLCGVVPNLQAQERRLVRVKVPFSFTAGDTTLPPGRYTAYVLNTLHVVRLQSEDGHHDGLLHLAVPRGPSHSGRAGFVFDCIDGDSFLSQVDEPNNR